MLNTLILENNPSREERHAILLNAIREALSNPDVEIEYAKNGKPKLKGSNKHISVTTTGNVMVCALADGNCGIDGEYMTRFTKESKIDYVAVAERFFSEEEADYVRGGDDIAVRFAKVWVRKEAYVKYTGKGLSDFPNFSVTDGEKFYSKVNSVQIKRLNLQFEGNNEYFFAIAGNES